ncbi:MAG: Holliday junction branch migration DNA helicase RuvB [Gemmatimonadaceae bacterium]
MSPAEITTPEEFPDDRGDELSLRPQRLAEFIGQPRIKENLAIAIEAAQQRREALDHILFHGPPGLGKTTLAELIAREMGVNLIKASGPSLEKPGDLVAPLTNLRPGDVLFIDEIHRLRPIIEEFLYPAMEDFKIELRIGDGPKAQTVTMPVEPFTLIGATTRLSMLTSPLRARFGNPHQLQEYPHDELQIIVTRTAQVLNVAITPEGAHELARRSRGTPRVAIRLLKRVRDFAQVRANGVIDCDVAQAALAQLHVDQLGLDEMDRRLLRIIVEMFDGGPVGLSTIAAAVGEPADTIEDVYEPFLVQNGLLQRTPRGRVATAHAYRHLGLPLPKPSHDQPQLF